MRLLPRIVVAAAALVSVIQAAAARDLPPPIAAETPLPRPRPAEAPARQAAAEIVPLPRPRPAEAPPRPLPEPSACQARLADDGRAAIERLPPLIGPGECGAPD